MKKPPRAAKTDGLKDFNDPSWMAAEIRSIDLKAYKSARALLGIAIDLLMVADTGTAMEPKPTARTLDLLETARKELRRVARNRSQTASN